ncbi:hypothetical protein [Frateuria defendens]|uniref:hypothetical protein n=1 Tax=Frateuria defendens TaxID=2219559 RepID=UPI00066FF5E3|nr:hypothetical protein [Frateuria defendens]
MQTLLVFLIVLHVLTGVFWAGTTFVLARTAGANAERLAYPQFGAAVATLAMGVAVWALSLRGVPAVPSTRVLGAAVLCALLAALVQGFALPAVRRLRDADAPRRRIAVSQRVAAVLLAATVAGMALWGHV